MKIEPLNIPEIPKSIIRYRKDGKLDRRFTYTKTKEAMEKVSGVSDYVKFNPPRGGERMAETHNLEKYYLPNTILIAGDKEYKIDKVFFTSDNPYIKVLTTTGEIRQTVWL